MYNGTAKAMKSISTFLSVIFINNLDFILVMAKLVEYYNYNNCVFTGDFSLIIFPMQIRMSYWYLQCNCSIYVQSKDFCLFLSVTSRIWKESAPQSSSQPREMCYEPGYGHRVSLRLVSDIMVPLSGIVSIFLFNVGLD